LKLGEPKLITENLNFIAYPEVKANIPNRNLQDDDELFMQASINETDMATYEVGVIVSWRLG
jgi:hypothetical protein